MSECGTVRGYGSGCRCSQCKDAKRAYVEEWHKRKLATGDVPHGLTAYRYGCRCDICASARSAAATDAEQRERDRQRKARARRLDRDAYNAKARDKRAARHASPVPESTPHGLAAYGNRGCRCDVCVEAARLASRQQQRDRQAATTASARRSGYRWTGPELEIVATRTDLSTVELAKMLGRTAFAVRDARVRVTHDPKWMKAAGVTDS